MITLKHFMYPGRFASRNQTGYVVLISVLIIGAIGLTISISILLFGLDFSRTSFATQQAAEARGLADACAEEGLQQIRDDSGFSGSSGLTLGNGSCTYTVVNTGGEARTIQSEATVGTVVIREVVTIDAISPQINVTSWQFVADF